MSAEQMPIGKDNEGITLDANTEETTENKVPRVELVLDTESGSMITQEEYREKMKSKLDDPFGNAAK